MESKSIIIIGGGPVGLSASILLSLRHIPHILFGRHTSTSIHPKACDINQRTTEIFRVMGIEDEAYAHAARYAVVADGGRALTEELGIGWVGERGIVDMVAAHFGTAALRSLHPDPRNFITWFSSPAMGGSTRTGYLYQIGPWPRAGRSGAVR